MTRTPTQQYTNTAEYSRYVSHPMPSAWEAVLRDFGPAGNHQPEPARPAATGGHAAPDHRPAPEKLFDKLMSALSERERGVVHGRLGLRLTLETLGERLGLTRERIRQLQKLCVHQTVREHKDMLEELISWVAEYGLKHLTVPETPSAVVPDATAESVLATLFSLCMVINPDPDQGPAAWLQDHLGKGTLRSVQVQHVRKTLRAEARFVTAAELETLCALRPGSIEPGPNSPHRGLYRTRNGLLALESWTVPQWTVAVARELARHGHTEWHFSEIAEALKFVAPHLFNGAPGNVVLTALLTDAGRALTEYAGHAGRYRLKEQGDGHTKNKDAVVAVLRLSNRPLSTEEIKARLNRDVALTTLQVLLSQKDTFRSFGNGVYNLRSQRRPKKTVADHLITELFHTLGRRTLAAETVHTAAAARGLDPADLMEQGQTSSYFRYRTSARHYVPLNTRPRRTK